MTLNILKLDPGHAFGRDGRAMSADNRETEHVSVMDQYAFGDADISNYNVLYVTDFIDQEYLYTQREKIAAFLDAGNIVVSCTHIFRPWLPNVHLFTPREIRKFSDYDVVLSEDSAIFEGVDASELVSRKGVAGFFARGFQPVYHDVEVHVRFTDGTPVTYVDRTSTNGTMFIHAARDILSFVTGDNTSQRIAPQMLEWLKRELQKENN